MSLQPTLATDELKLRTRDLHHKIEADVKIFDRIRTKEGYAELLGKMCGYYSVMEEALGNLDWNSAGLNFEERRKTNLLQADLSGLEKTPGTKLFSGPIPFANLAGGFGSLYVLEGSTLGGQFILKDLLSRGPWAVENSRFYRGYGARTMEMWNEFKNAANRFCGNTPGAVELAVESAAATFEQFGAWVSHAELEK